MISFAGILLGLGIGIILLTIAAGEFNTWYFAWGQKLFQLGFFFGLFWLGLKLVDFQPVEIKENRLPWLQPLVSLGRVSLSVFILEGTLAVILQRVIAPFWPNWNSSAANAALFGLINVAAWSLIILVWKKVDFAGSLEWSSAWLIKTLSGKRTYRPDDSMNID